MTKTIEDMKNAKADLNQQILELLRKFEDDLGVRVESVDLDTRYFIGSSSEICGVSVKVEI